MNDAEKNLRKMAEKGDIQAIRNILYPGWIYPRLVLWKIYVGKHQLIRNKIAEFVGIPGIDINATDNQNARTALHWASIFGSPDCVEILLKFGANINATDKWGETALVCASRWGKPNCVEILLKNKADSTLKPRWDNKTAYQFAGIDDDSKKAEIQAVFHKYGIHQ